MAECPALEPRGGDVDPCQQGRPPSLDDVLCGGLSATTSSIAAWWGRGGRAGPSDGQLSASIWGGGAGDAGKQGGTGGGGEDGRGRAAAEGWFQQEQQSILGRHQVVLNPISASLRMSK